MHVDRLVVAPSRSRTSGPQPNVASIVKRFDSPERVLVFDQGRLEVITVGGRAVGKGSYGPGWRWSNAARAVTPGVRRPPEHVGVVLSGRAKLVVEDVEMDLAPGDFFHIATEFESWVLGYRPCEVLYLSGVEALVNRLHQE